MQIVIKTTEKKNTQKLSFSVQCTLLCMNIRHDQYWQIAYQKFLITQNCIKKDLKIYSFLMLKKSYFDFEVNSLVLR